MKTIRAVDLFAGAGGTSEGLRQACAEKEHQLKLTAINHWGVAIETHSRNHPNATHLCEDLDNVNPRKVVPDGRLDLLVASPECQHHSKARGGKPINDQSRSSCWHILRWAEALYVQKILIENVPEFESFGPLGANGKPLKSMKGLTFQAFLNALRSLGYRVEYRILNAANYGDPTSRRRLFILAQRGNKPINWPEVTHTPTGETNLFGSTQAWRTAAEIIDWSVPSQSIFTRRKPLKPATLKRIAVGLQKFGLGQTTPFLVKYYGGHTSEPLDKPLPTITASYEHFALVEPFIVELRNNCDVRKLTEPLTTITTQTHHALCQPFLVEAAHGDDAFPGRRTAAITEPLKTVTTSNAFAIAQPFLIKYNRTGKAYPLSEPIDTITTNDRFGLVQPLVNLGNGYGLDIHFRMLRPHELAAAQGFTNYEFTGKKKDVIRQIGNAVPVNLAKALCSVLI
ncbi:MAG: DNA cytosine methyltransferase [Acidobacteria bacterium]|nr:DNA cytosine methyltransferase [Acidobacteriota bacterium]